MADPKEMFKDRQSNLNGVGPFQFNADEIQVDGRFTVDLREREKGRFVTLSPEGYDNISISNNSGTPVRVLLNETNEFYVAPSVSESIELEGVYRIEVFNEGSTKIPANDVRITILQSGYGADEQAKVDANKSRLQKIVENFTGLN